MSAAEEAPMVLSEHMALELAELLAEQAVEQVGVERMSSELLAEMAVELGVDLAAAEEDGLSR